MTVVGNTAGVPFVSTISPLNFRVSGAIARVEYVTQYVLVH
ncbi:MAG: hypothetical protein PHG86_05885 [Candidatus Methanomethylophilaceae archaeon]|nr:hypothetical protein [Candidatus Methanomethylophilaceae archaeon]